MTPHTGTEPTSQRALSARGRTHGLVALGLFVGIVGCGPAMDRRIEDRDARVDDYLQQLVDHRAYAAVQYVAFDASTVLYSGTAGYADVKGRIPMTMDHRVELNSATKLTTAIAVLQLQEQGLLAIDQSLTTYLPEIPYDVTIRQMLSHSSGIGDPSWGNYRRHLPSEHPFFDREAALREVVGRHGELVHAPGTKTLYSNLAYAILGHLIEERSGLSYEDYVRRNIFMPIGVDEHETGFDIEGIADQAKPYFSRNSMLSNLFATTTADLDYSVEGPWIATSYPWYVDFPGHAGLVGRPSGFVALLQELLAPSTTLLSEASVDAFFESQSDAYALGWEHHEGSRGHVGFSQWGSGLGYDVILRIFPGSGVGSVMFTTGTDPFSLPAYHTAIDAEVLP